MYVIKISFFRETVVFYYSLSIIFYIRRPIRSKIDRARVHLVGDN